MNRLRLPPRLRDALVAAVLIVVAALVSWNLRPLAQPWLLVFGIWSLLLFVGFIVVRARPLRALLLTGSSLAVGLLLAEAGLQAFDFPPPSHSRFEGGCASAEYWRHVNEIGFAAEVPRSYDCRKFIGGELAYDVVYGFEAHHLRVTAGNPAGDTILFFGCSYTFGEGLDDDETLPYGVSRQLGFRYNVVNFAFHGYGPHQMLRALERGIPPDLVSGQVKRVFYVAAPFHMYRAAGLERWAQNGPRYELDPQGEARYAGVGFPSFVPASPPKQVKTSHLVRLVWDAREAYRKTWVTWQAELLAAIVKRSATLVRERFDAPFSVLVWDDDRPSTQKMLAALRAAGIDPLLVSDTISPADRRKYAIPLDGHPGLEANRLLAPRLAALVE